MFRWADGGPDRVTSIDYHQPEEFHMLPKRRLPTHPGEILLEEFLRPLAITQVRFARHLGISLQRVNEIVRGKRGVTPETAWLPMAFLVEQAGGAATNGKQRIMDLMPSKLHERVSVILGSKNEVERATAYHLEAEAATK